MGIDSCQSFPPNWAQIIWSSVSVWDNLGTEFSLKKQTKNKTTVKVSRWCVKTGITENYSDLIWLFYPLARQRTKCIDSSATAPPVSGMYFTHPSVKHSALWSSCEVTDIPGQRQEERKTSQGQQEKLFSFKAGKGDRKGQVYIHCQSETQEFWPSMQQTPLWSF